MKSSKTSYNYVGKQIPNRVLRCNGLDGDGDGNAKKVLPAETDQFQVCHSCNKCKACPTIEDPIASTIDAETVNMQNTYPLMDTGCTTPQMLTPEMMQMTSNGEFMQMQMPPPGTSIPFTGHSSMPMQGQMMSMPVSFPVNRQITPPGSTTNTSKSSQKGGQSAWSGAENAQSPSTQFQYPFGGVQYPSSIPMQFSGMQMQYPSIPTNSGMLMGTSIPVGHSLPFSPNAMPNTVMYNYQMQNPDCLGSNSITKQIPGTGLVISHTNDLKVTEGARCCSKKNR